MPDTGQTCGPISTMILPSLMASNTRILNVTRGFRLKPSQVERAFLNCAMVWVEEGVSVRDCTLAESIAGRNEQAKVREPLAYAEIPGLTYDPCTSGQAASRESQFLIRQAHEWAMAAV